MLVTSLPAQVLRHCQGALEDQGLALEAGIANAAEEAVGEEARTLVVAVRENSAVQRAELVFVEKGSGGKD